MAVMKFLVKTDNPGTSSSFQFTLPLRPLTEEFPKTYNFNVNWGDSTVDTITGNDSPTHTYASAGTYEISITENAVEGFPTIFFNNSGDRLKIIDLTAWGTNKWDTFKSSFYGCANMVISATDEATANTSSVLKFCNIFRECTSLTSFPLIDTSSAEDLSSAWRGCTSLTSFPLIDTCSVEDLSSAWRGCTSLTSFPLIDTCSVEDISSAWQECTSLTSFPLIDTSYTNSFSWAWLGCSSLTSFPLLNTSSVTSMDCAWSGCTSLISFPLIDTSSVANMKSTWNGCASLTTFPLIDTSSVNNMDSAWEGCVFLTFFPLIDTSSVISMKSTWSRCNSLTSFPLIDTSSVTSFLSAWYGCVSLTSFPTLNMSSCTNFMSTWQNCPLLTDSYSDIIEYLADNNTNTGVTLGANLAKYSASVALKHTILTDVRSWTITDAGLESEPEPTPTPERPYSYSSMDFIGMSPSVLFTLKGDKLSDTKFGNPKGNTVSRDENLADGSTNGKPVRTSRGGGSNLNMYSKPSWLYHTGL